MENVRFVLPTLGTAAIPTTEQNDLMLNQATAVIVAAWLNHANVVNANAAALNLVSTGTHSRFEWLVTRAELPGFIDSVQAALKSL